MVSRKTRGIAAPTDRRKWRRREQNRREQIAEDLKAE
jgi:hypothetical protein